MVVVDRVVIKGTSIVILEEFQQQALNSYILIMWA